MDDRVDVAHRPRRQRLPGLVVLAAGLLQHPVMGGQPHAGQLRERHVGERVRRDVVAPVLDVGRPRLRLDPQPVDDLGAVRAELLLARARPARRARRRPAWRGAPAARPAWSYHFSPFGPRRLVPKLGCPIAHRSVPFFSVYGHTEPSPGLRRLRRGPRSALSLRPSPSSRARCSRTGSNMPGSSSSASARPTHRTSASSSSSPTNTSVPWVGMRGQVDHPAAGLRVYPLADDVAGLDPQPGLLLDLADRGVRRAARRAPAHPR